ncbi:hypothetical protein MHTCC0001_18050 [Flavobacteriaceae bacterium MHTCC 0001]
MLLLNSCIGEDIVDDFVEPTIRINNPIGGLKVNDTHNFMATYFNNIGEEATTTITWSSSNNTIVSITNGGLATALAEGQTTITAMVTNNGTTINDTNTITVVAADEEVPDPPASNSKSGTLRTTSSYQLEGDFSLSIIENTNDLRLVLDSNYIADSSLPGLYLYLTNNPSSVNGAKEVGKVEVFNGAHEYTIPDTDINDFKYLLYWCKPFRVKVGDAEIE